ncbi:beta-ketoacyl synthase N-terminal-like domain-containing protein [Streptomyces rectiverticillatus]|uniref:beta-ketoacyl synthase N-terminal-like domain-containing protein n=1 Tax=Streptomyces rectiverticillatus TaxID=173860 RepID=UPI001FE5839E|nr:beta-ketoacyl synthase N-terminal-like domain-containing protein [Streptomyces rectiverticillatus]
MTPEEFGEFDIGAVTANAIGGLAYIHGDMQRLWSQDPDEVSVYGSIAWFYAVNTGQISIRHGLRGSSCTLSAEQAGGLDAIGEARRAVRSGVPLILCGGVDSALDPLGWVSMIASGKVSSACSVDEGYLPFDERANGYIPGEGGAMLLLENADRARRRGRSAYGELAGYAATFDPAPGSLRLPGLRRSAELAMADAGIGPSQIDAVFADAAGTLEQDIAEANAISGIFGPMAVPVTAPKAATGRLFSGGGPLDVVTALLAMRDGLLPPTENVRRLPRQYSIDLVRDAPRVGRYEHVLVLARGHGGFNAALVLRRGEGVGAAP